MSDYSAEYYKALADKSKKKSERLKKAVSHAGSLITDARTEKKKLVSKSKPSIWKGSTADSFSFYSDFMNQSAGRFIDQMDSVRDGYNLEQAAADRSYWFFINQYKQLKAKVENALN